MKKTSIFRIITAIIGPIIIEQLYVVTGIVAFFGRGTHYRPQDAIVFAFIYYGLLQPIGAVALSRNIVSFLKEEANKLWWLLSAFYVPSAVTLCFYLHRAIKQGTWMTFSERFIYLFLWLLLWSSIVVLLRYIILRKKNKKIEKIDPQTEQTT